MDDFWPGLYEDKYAVLRIKKCVELAATSPGHRVLDVGCHKGELRGFLPKDIDYLGIDHLTGTEIDGGFNLDIWVGKDPIRFDRIFCLETLEHLTRPAATIESICSYLKEEGLLIVSLPNEASLFHRIRCLLGIVDAECFSSRGKHLHLPSLKQCRAFLVSSGHLQIMGEGYYVSPSAAGSKQVWVGKILSLIPDGIHQLLAEMLPSLFARGFIFVCRKNLPNGPSYTAPP